MRPKETRARKVLNEERRTNWQIANAAAATDFERRMASWTGVTPTPRVEEVVRDLYKAWWPTTQQYMQDLLDQARRDPGRGGLARAIRSVRRIWREVMVEEAPNQGGRPPEWAERKFNVWLMFNAALGKAKLANPKMTKAAMMREFAEKSRRGRGYWHNKGIAVGHGGSQRLPKDAVKLSSVAQLEKLLKSVERAIPKQQRTKMLRHYLPDVCHLLDAPKRGRNSRRK